MKQSTTLLSAATALILLGAMPGCGRDVPEEDPNVSVAALIGEGSDLAHALYLSGLTGGPALASSGAGPIMAARCDGEPDIQNQDVCGVLVPETMRFEWTACGAPPGDGPSPPEDFSCPNHGGVPQGDEIMSRGTVDITNTVALDPVIGGTPEALIGCDSSTVLSWKQTSVVDMERAGRWGNTVHLTGKTQSEAKHALDASTLEIGATLDTVRTMKDENGTVIKSVRIQGRVETVLDRSAMPPVRTMNGTMEANFGEGEIGKVQLKDVVRQGPMACFWPISGTVLRTDAEGREHKLEFGPGCGEATLDGEAITLHVGRGGPGGPVGKE